MTDGAHQSFTPRRREGERERRGREGARKGGAVCALTPRRPSLPGGQRNPGNAGVPVPGESVPKDCGGGGGETKRKIMIAGTPKHNDNIHCWAMRKERKEEERDGRTRTEMDG